MQRIKLYNLVRPLLTLVLAVVTAVSAWATGFIKEVKLIGGNKAEILTQIITYQNQGWSIVEKDLNDGADGNYILLIYKTDGSSDGFDYGGSITGFYISNDYASQVSYGGRTYYPVPCAGGDDFVDGHGDLNEGCGSSSAYIYLYYTRDPYPDRKIVTGISFNGTQSGAVGLCGDTDGYDLNSGAGGDYIYMHVTRTAPREPVRIGDGSSGTNTIPFYLGNSYYPYSLSQQIFTADEIGMAGSIKAISFLHRMSDMSLSMNGVKVYMKHTDKDAFTGSELDPLDDFVKVFDGSVSASGTQWMTIRLDTPFEYDGNSNLMVCCYDPVGVHPSGNTFTYHYADNKMRGLATHDPINVEETLAGSGNTTMRNDVQLNIVPNAYPNPVKLKVNGFTDKSASVSWSAPSGSHPAILRYEWQYKLSDAADWSALSSTTETTASLSGLSAFQEYIFRVRAIYSGGESSYSIRRFVTALELPYDCGFENGMPRWTQVDHNHFYNDDLTGIKGEARRDGDYGYLFRCYNTDPVPQYLISPGLPRDKEIAVSFYYKNYASSSPETFQVGYSTSTPEVSAFTWGEEITATGTEWWQYQHTFPVGTQYVAVKYTSNSYCLFLDDFEFVAYSSYAKPTGLTVDELGNQGVKLKWSAPSDGATGYAYQYRAVSGDWSAEATASGTSVTLSGLSANTSYDFRVKAFHGSNGTLASNYETLRFMTEGPEESLPHLQDFENGMGGWRLENGHGRSGITTTEKHEGSNGFEFDFEEDNLEAQYLRSPQLVGGSAPLVFSFFFKNYSEPLNQTQITSYPSFFQLGWSSSTQRLEDFQWSEEYTTSSGQWERITLQVPKGTQYVIIKQKGGAPWLYVDDIRITEAPKPVARLATVMGESKYVATFYDGSGSWQLPEGGLAYTVNQEGDDYVLYCLDDIIPAGTAVIILLDQAPGETAGTKAVELSVATAFKNPVPGNVLSGSDSPVAVSGGKINNKVVYVLGIKDGVPGFHPFSGSEIPAGKAYYLAE